MGDPHARGETLAGKASSLLLDFETLLLHCQYPRDRRPAGPGALCTAHCARSPLVGLCSFFPEGRPPWRLDSSDEHRICGIRQERIDGHALTCCFTLAMAFFAIEAAGTPPASKSLRILFGYAFLGLAVLSKGPVALILAAGIGLLFWFFVDREMSSRRRLLIPGLLVTAAVSIPWFWLVFRQNGFSFILTFFINQNLARYVTGIHHHSQPFYYFLPVVLAIFLPWSGWLPLLIPKAETVRNRRNWNKGTLFLACWFVFQCSFFQFLEAKLTGYILPSIPPLALMLGVHDAIMGWTRPMAENVHMGVSGLFDGNGCGGSFLFPKGIRQSQGRTHSFGRNCRPGHHRFLVWKEQQPCRGTQGNCGAGADRGRGNRAVCIFPVLGAYLSTRDIAYRALELKKAEEPIVTYRFFQHSLHYYTGYGIADEFDRLGITEPHSAGPSQPSCRDECARDERAGRAQGGCR